MVNYSIDLVPCEVLAHLRKFIVSQVIFRSFARFYMVLKIIWVTEFTQSLLILLICMNFRQVDLQYIIR